MHSIYRNFVTFLTFPMTPNPNHLSQKCHKSPKSCKVSGKLIRTQYEFNGMKLKIPPSPLFWLGPDEGRTEMRRCQQIDISDTCRLVVLCVWKNDKIQQVSVVSGKFVENSMTISEHFCWKTENNPFKSFLGIFWYVHFKQLEICL